MSESEPLRDDDPMPFGKHEGERLDQVPASYLLWFMEQEWAEKSYPRLYVYCEEKHEELIDEKKEEKR